MNRRDFLKRLGGAAAAISLSPLLDLAPIEPVVSGFAGPITFKGIPLVYDQFCSANAWYVVNRREYRLWIPQRAGAGGWVIEPKSCAGPTSTTGGRE